MTDYTCDVLILEDNPISQKHIGKVMPEGANCKYTGSVLEFIEFFGLGGKAKLYLMDDRVPFSQGDLPSPQFIANCGTLYSKHPDAKVFYNGSCPGLNEEIFCNDHGIEILSEKGIFELGEIVERELRG